MVDDALAAIDAQLLTATHGCCYCSCCCVMMMMMTTTTTTLVARLACRWSPHPDVTSSSIYVTYKHRVGWRV